VFLGEYQHSLDAKGRVILPSKFRGLLAGGCIVTRGQDACIAIYPKDAWEQLSTRLEESSQAAKRARDFRRIWYASAIEEEPDKQGRITIPEHLREYAGLERDVTVAGDGKKIEIWAREAWARRLSEAVPAYSEIAETDPDIVF